MARWPPQSPPKRSSNLHLVRGRYRIPAAVAVFSDRLARLCAEGGHTFFDPFAAWRAGTGGLAGPGLHRDGVHLVDYAPLAAALSRAVAGMVHPAGRPLRPDVPCPGPRPTPVATAPAATAPLRVLRAAWVGRP